MVLAAAQLAPSRRGKGRMTVRKASGMSTQFTSSRLVVKVATAQRPGKATTSARWTSGMVAQLRQGVSGGHRLCGV